MQAIFDYVMTHLWLILVVAYEVWSLIPEDKVKSSSLLTWIGNLLKTAKDANPPPK